MYLTDLQGRPRAALRARALRPLHRLLPAGARRPARALERDHAPARRAALRPARRGRALRPRPDAAGRSGLAKKVFLGDPLADYVNPVFAGRRRRQGRHGRRRPGRRRSASPSRSISTSPATPTWRSASRCCSASCCRRISTCPTAPTSLQDFWRRWHMTLSRFLRDYLYVPLGGNRRGLARPGRGPLRHHDAGRPLARGRPDLRRLGRGARARARRRPAVAPGGPARCRRSLGWALTFVFVVLTWVLFRADELRGGAADLSRALFGLRRRGRRLQVAHHRDRRRWSPLVGPTAWAAVHRLPPRRSIAVGFALAVRDRAAQDRRRCELRVHLLPVLRMADPRLPRTGTGAATGAASPAPCSCRWPACSRAISPSRSRSIPTTRGRSALLARGAVRPQGPRTASAVPRARSGLHGRGDRQLAHPAHRAGGAEPAHRHPLRPALGSGDGSGRSSSRCSAGTCAPRPARRDRARRPTPSGAPTTRPSRASTGSRTG